MNRRQIQTPNDLLRVSAVRQMYASAPFLFQHVTPIYISDEKGRPKLEGSGILVSADGKKFLVTAAHVTDVLERSDLIVFGTADRHALRLEGNMGYSMSEDGQRKNDKIDVSVIELKDELVGHFLRQSFWPLSKVDLLDDGKEEAAYMVTGYPAVLCKGRDPNTGKVSPPAVMHLTQVRLPSPLPRLGRSAETHIFLRFKKNKVYIDGRKSTAPDPYGMSGGAIWRRDVNTAEGWMLVGMATDWNTEYAGFVVLRFKEVLGLIKHMHPDINIFEN